MGLPTCSSKTKSSSFLIPSPGVPSAGGPQFPFNGQDQQLGLADVTQSAWGLTHSALKPKGRKNTLTGPISKKRDSQLMQRLSASSPAHLCGLLPILPKSYNLLALAIDAQHSLEWCTSLTAAVLPGRPLTDGSVFHTNRGRRWW